MSYDLTNLKGGLDYIGAAAELRGAYDEDYQISAGYYGLTMSEEETLTGGKSLYEYWLETYDQYKIWDRWHISFDEYIDRPSFIMEAMNQTAERLKAKDQALLNGIKPPSTT